MEGLTEFSPIVRVLCPQCYRSQVCAVTNGIFSWSNAGEASCPAGYPQEKSYYGKVQKAAWSVGELASTPGTAGILRDSLSGEVTAGPRLHFRHCCHSAQQLGSSPHQADSAVEDLI